MRTCRYFYNSSVQLAHAWVAAGNRHPETHFGTGGHCVMHSFTQIAQCLDDHTGRLIPPHHRHDNYDHPTPTTTTTIKPSQAQAL